MPFIKRILLIILISFLINPLFDCKNVKAGAITSQPDWVGRQLELRDQQRQIAYHFHRLQNGSWLGIGGGPYRSDDEIEGFEALSAYYWISGDENAYEAIKTEGLGYFRAMQSWSECNFDPNSGYCKDQYQAFDSEHVTEGLGVLALCLFAHPEDTEVLSILEKIVRHFGNWDDPQNQFVNLYNWDSHHFRTGILATDGSLEGRLRWPFDNVMNLRWVGYLLAVYLATDNSQYLDWLKDYLDGWIYAKELNEQENGVGVVPAYCDPQTGGIYRGSSGTLEWYDGEGLGFTWEQGFRGLRALPTAFLSYAQFTGDTKYIDLLKDHMKYLYSLTTDAASLGLQTPQQLYGKGAEYDCPHCGPDMPSTYIMNAMCEPCLPDASGELAYQRDSRGNIEKNIFGCSLCQDGYTDGENTHRYPVPYYHWYPGDNEQPNKLFLAVNWLDYFQDQQFVQLTTHHFQAQPWPDVVNKVWQRYLNTEDTEWIYRKTTTPSKNQNTINYLAQLDDKNQFIADYDDQFPEPETLCISDGNGGCSWTCNDGSIGDTLTGCLAPRGEEELFATYFGAPTYTEGSMPFMLVRYKQPQNTSDTVYLKEGLPEKIAALVSPAGPNAVRVRLYNTNNASAKFAIQGGFVPRPIDRVVLEGSDANNSNQVNNFRISDDKLKIYVTMPASWEYTIVIHLATSTQPPPSVPTAPANLQASITQSTTLTLSWEDRSNNEDNFIVNYGLKSSGTSINSLTTISLPANTTNQTINQGLVAGQTYTFRLTASNAAGESQAISIDYTIPTNPTPTVPSAPSGLTAPTSGISQNQILLNWTDSSNNETGFKIEQSSNNQTWNSITTINNANVMSYTAINLTPSTTYYFRVKAFNATGDSQPSNVVQVTTSQSISISSTEISTGEMLGTNYNKRWFYIKTNGGEWQPTYTGSEYKPEAQGKLMNMRAANAIFDDDRKGSTSLPNTYNPDINTGVFINQLDSYKEHGVIALSIGLQGGYPGYDNAVASAFNSDGSLRNDWMSRAADVIEAANEKGMIVILQYFYQRQIGILSGETAVRNAVINATDWLINHNYRNVIIEIANEHNHGGFSTYPIIQSDSGIAQLVNLAKTRFDGKNFKLPVTASLGGGDFPGSALKNASDLVLLHGNGIAPATDAANVATMIADTTTHGPVVMNEDRNTETTATAESLSAEKQTASGIFSAGGSWGFMLYQYCQYYPFSWKLGDTADVSSLENLFKAVLMHIKSLVMEGAGDPRMISASGTSTDTYVDDTGRIHVMWTEADGIHYQNTTDQGKTWQGKQLIPNTAGGADARMAVTPDQQIHAIWLKDLQVYYTFYNGTSWSTPIDLNNYGSSYSRNPRLALDNNNNLHVTWWNKKPQPLNPELEDVECHVFYRFRSASGTWGRIYQLSPEGIKQIAKTSHIAITNEGAIGTAHIVMRYNNYEPNANTGWRWDMYYARVEGGYDLQEARNLSNASPKTQHWTAIAADAKNNLYTAFPETSNVMFRKRINHNWQGIETLSTGNTAAEGATFPEIAADNQDKVYVVWNKDNLNLYYKIWDGQSWSSEKQFAQTDIDAGSISSNPNQPGCYVSWISGGGVYFSNLEDSYDPPDPPPAACSGLTNITAASGIKYTCAKINVYDEYYIDRAFVATNIPTILSDTTWIKTANNDKDRTEANFLSFTVNNNVTVYVGFDSRATQIPTWLQSWTQTGQQIATSDTSMGSFNVYKKDFPAGQITLGGNSASGASWPTGSGKGNYIVIIAGLVATGPVCGNSVVETGEQCDDGNTLNGDGCSSLCQIENPTPTLPAAPSGLAAPASGITQNQVLLNWTDNSDNEIGFRIEQSLDNRSWNSVGTTNQNISAYTALNLTPSTTYYFRVKAFNTAGESGISNVIQVATKPPTGNDTYTLSASPSSVRPQGQISVTWTAPQGQTSATDWVGLFKVGTPNTQYLWQWSYTNGQTSGTRTFTAPTENGTYEFRYLLNNGYESVATSNPIIVEDGVVDQKPTPPSNLTATAISTSQINLSWTDSQNETSFRIEQNLSSGTQSWTTLASNIPANTTTYSAINLSSDTTYYFRIIAVNEFGESLPSNIASAKTLPGTEPPPTGFLQLSPIGSTTDINVDSSGTIHVVWTQSDGVHYQFTTDQGNTWEAKQVIPNSAGAFFARVAATPEYGVNVVWANYHDGYHSVLKGSAWSAPYVFGDHVEEPRIAVDNQGNLHVTWRKEINNPDGVDGKETHVIYRRRTEAGTWGPRMFLAPGNDPLQVAKSPIITTTESAYYGGVANIALRYGDYGDSDPQHRWDVYYVAVVNGDNLTDETFLTRNSYKTDHWTSIAADANNNLYVAYPEANMLRFKKTTTTGWSTPETLSSDNTGGLLYPEVALDNSGKTYVLWNRDSTHLYYMIFNGQSWSTLKEFAATDLSWGSISANPHQPGCFVTWIMNGAVYFSKLGGSNLQAPVLTAQVASESQINLSWTDQNSETGYKIERGLGVSPVSWSEIATVTANITSYQNTGLTQNTSYSYRVKAFNADGNGPYSNIVTATTLSTAVKAPTNLTATAISSSQINLTWVDNSNNETGFSVEFGLGTNPTSWTQIAQIGANVSSFQHTGLTANTTYSYRVRAFNSTEYSGYSNIATATTQDGQTKIILEASPISVKPGEIITVNWKTPVDQANYSDWIGLYHVGDADNSHYLDWHYTFGKTSGTMTFTAPEEPGNYEFRYLLRNGYQNVATSNIVTITKTANIPQAPTLLTATAISSSEIILSWTDNSNNETAFKIERGLGSNPTTWIAIAESGQNVISFRDIDLTADTTYSYRVCAVNTAGTSGYSNISSATTFSSTYTWRLTATPTVIKPGQIITVEWTAPVNETFSDDAIVFYKVNASFFDYIFWQRTGGNPNGTISFMAPEEVGEYEFRYLTNNTDTVIIISNVVTVTNEETPTLTIPQAPTSLVANKDSATQINLTWVDNSTNEEGFKIERSLNPTAEFSQIATVANGLTSFTNTELSPGTTYYYRVLAYNSAGDSSYSNTASATTSSSGLTVTLTASPTSIKPNDPISVSWNISSGQTTPKDWIGIFSAGTGNMQYLGYQYTNGQSSGTRQFTAPAQLGNYEFRYLLNDGYESAGQAISITVTSQPQITIPTGPSSLNTTPISTTQINLTWADNSTNETGFKIERSPNASSGFAQIATVGANATSYSSNGLSANTTYYYRVRAYNSAGDSSYSNTANATTQSPVVTVPNPPSFLTGVSPSSNQVNLTWTDNSSDETGFKIERGVSSNPSAWSQIMTVASNVIDYSDTGLMANTTYSYRIRAYNATGDSNYSSIAVITTSSSTCSDGTIYNGCSTNKPYYCDNGSLVPKASQCQCPVGYVALGENCVRSSPSNTCSDGTIYNECSSNKPFFCNNGQLVEKASQCGCPTGKEVQVDNCITPNEPNISNPYQPKANLYKGQLHAHTTNSDGKVSPSNLMTFYKNAGYAFVSITDHNVLSPNPNVSGILYIPGVEESFDEGHIGHINAQSVLYNENKDRQTVINEIVNEGTLASINHAALPGVPFVDYASFSNYQLFEVYNHFGGPYQGVSENEWDVVLSKGIKAYGISTDDYHCAYRNDGTGPCDGGSEADFNGGWVKVWADDLSLNSIVDSLKKGNFYASTGADFSNITLTNNVIQITATRSSQIQWIKNNGVVAKTTQGTSDSYTINGDEKYIRVKISNDSGQAWSNPFFIKGLNNPTTCSDGTSYNQCSTNKPYYCNNGSLIERASQCGCPTGMQVQVETCVTSSTSNIINPYAAGGQAFKGQLHTHTQTDGTNDDGDATPYQLMTNYKNAGYNFVAITGHNTIIPNPGVNGILYIPGDEETSTQGHVGNIGAVSNKPVVRAEEIMESILADGAIFAINHANYAPILFTALSDVPSGGLIEIYNGTTNTFAEDDWDYLLSHNVTSYGTATDDCHTNAGRDFNVGWIVAYASSLSQQNILSSLKSGNFYASTGADFSNISVTNNTINVTTRLSSQIQWIKTGGEIIKTTPSATSDSYTIQGDEGYVRIKIKDYNGQAWSNPIFVNN